MRYVFGNAQHIGARQQQQDSFGFTDPANETFAAHSGFVAVLADGMGGMANGDAASRTAVRAFLAEYERKTPEESIPDALFRSLRGANDAVYSLAGEMGAAGEMGTTLIAAALLDDIVHWISVGDSGVFLFRDGELTTLNSPHVYARDLAEKVAAGVIAPEAAASHPERESLTSYVGTPDLNQVDRTVRAFPLERDDCLLLASDGLFKTLNEMEMTAAMAGTLQQRCELLVTRTLEKQFSSQDNITVIAVAPVSAVVQPAAPLPITARPVVEPPAVLETVRFDPVAVPPAFPPAMAVPLPHPAHAPRRMSVLALVLLVGLLAAAAGYYFSWRKTNPPKPIPQQPVSPKGSQPLERGKKNQPGRKSAPDSKPADQQDPSTIPPETEHPGPNPPSRPGESRPLAGPGARLPSGAEAAPGPVSPESPPPASPVKPGERPVTAPQDPHAGPRGKGK